MSGLAKVGVCDQPDWGDGVVEPSRHVLKWMADRTCSSKKAGRPFRPGAGSVFRHHSPSRPRQRSRGRKRHPSGILHTAQYSPENGKALAQVALLHAAAQTLSMTFPRHGRALPLASLYLWVCLSLAAVVSGSLVGCDGAEQDTAQSGGPVATALDERVDAPAEGRLLGMHIDSPEVQAFIDANLDNPERTELESALYLDSPGTGMSLGFSRAPDQLEAIHFYARDEKYQQYAGELPFALSFSHRRRDVERLLGRPVWSSDIDGELSVNYPRLGLSIDYGPAEGLRDPSASIAHVSLHEPEEVTLRHNSSPHHSAPRIAMRLVVQGRASNAEALEARDEGDESLFVEREVLLDETSIAEVYPLELDREAGVFVVGLRMNDRGTERLQEISRLNQGRRLAVVLDGELLVAPMVMGELSEWVALNMAGDFDHFHDVLGRLHAALNSLPAED